MILNGKEVQLVVVYMGTVLFPFFTTINPIMLVVYTFKHYLKTCLLLVIVRTYAMLPKYQNLPYLVAIVDCTYTGHLSNRPLTNWFAGHESGTFPQSNTF